MKTLCFEARGIVAKLSFLYKKKLEKTVNN